jgi:RNA methyltransferase, TrmH family
MVTTGNDADRARRAVDIDSPSNPRVKVWRSLRTREARDRTGTCLIEGRREVERAAAQVEIIEFIARSDRIADVPEGATVVSERVFSRLSARQNPDGIAAVVRTPSLSLANLPEAPRMVLVGDGIEKPGNVGAMIRTADAFDATFVGSSLGTDLANPNVIRAAQGSLFSRPIASADRSDVIRWCTHRTQVVVASPIAGLSAWEADFRRPTSVVIGNEHLGVSEDWFAVGTRISIPISGTADSLNASVAAAVLLAEATRQRST